MDKAKFVNLFFENKLYFLKQYKYKKLRLNFNVRFFYKLKYDKIKNTKGRE